MKKVQVLNSGQWEYVFCYSLNEPGKIVTTKDKKKALSASQDMEYFKNNFANHQFRGI